MLRIHRENRYFCTAEGDPFFYLADTAWNIFQRLSREEMEWYATVRAGQGFTGIQVVALFAEDCFTSPNAYGRLPFHLENGAPCISRPDTTGEYSYWAHVRYLVELAAEQGLTVAMFPVWGDHIYSRSGSAEAIHTDNAGTYGRFLGDLLGGYGNLLWVLGGDRPLERDRDRETLRALAGGIRDSGAGQLVSFHPPGPALLPFSSADYVNGEDWLDFHMIQSGHEVEEFDNWSVIRRTINSVPCRPVLDGEARYEDHPACFRPETDYYWDGADVRRTAWWSVLEGACGHTYGNHCIWDFNQKPAPYFPLRWQEALDREGARTLAHLPRLLLSRPYFERRPAPELVEDDGGLLGHVAACRGERYAFLYSPDGRPLRVMARHLGAKTLKASWYDPRTGKTSVIGIVPGKEMSVFVPPTSSKGNDWVLVLDSLDHILQEGGSQL